MAPSRLQVKLEQEMCQHYKYSAQNSPSATQKLLPAKLCRAEGLLSCLNFFLDTLQEHLTNLGSYPNGKVIYTIHL